MVKTLWMAMVLLVAAGWALAADAADPVVQPAKEIKLDLGNNETMKLVLIPAGKFLMGSPKDEAGRSDDEGLPRGQWVKGEPRVEVMISKPFYLGMHHVTVDQYAQFWKDSDREDRGALLERPNFKQGGDHPAVCVNWYDAQAFCKWLSKKTGKTVVLPTEAQWEYACRAGTQTRFSFGDKDENLDDHAWYEANNSGMTHPVGQKKPNAWGLYDMHGNAWAWCSDYYASEYGGAVVDPVGPKEGRLRVLRGGCWYGRPARCRSAHRLRGDPDIRLGIVGIRVAVVAADAE